MLQVAKIKSIIEDKIKDSNIYIVDISIRPGNNITVFLDSMDNVSINDCINISRHIEKSLNRDEEDFSLEVSSAGLSTPFKVKEQYKKHIGKKIRVKTNEGNIIKGLLLSFNDVTVTLETNKKIKKEKTTQEIIIDLNKIVETKLDIF